MSDMFVIVMMVLGLVLAVLGGFVLSGDILAIGFGIMAGTGTAAIIREWLT